VDYPIISENENMLLQQDNLGGEMNPFDLEAIKIPAAGGKQWTIPALTGDRSVKTIEGIIVAWNKCRGYWPGDYSGAEPPQCSSRDGLTGEGDPGIECAECMFAKYESAAKGKGQACKDMRRVFIILEGNVLPCMINLPPTSIKPFRQYMMRLTSSQTHFSAVVTTIELEEAQNDAGTKYSKTVFSCGKILEAEESEKTLGYSNAMKKMFTSRPVDDDAF